jgi:protein SCO1
MHSFRISLSIALLVLCALTMGMSSCRRPRTGARYNFKGKVVSVEKDKQEVTISHQEIKGYMPAMVMPFKLKDPEPFEILGPGDQITATLVVDGRASWLEDVVIMQMGPAGAAPGSEGGTIEAEEGAEVPNYGLINQDGKLIKIHDYRGKALLLTFIYTRCPDPNYCTLMSSRFAQVNQELQKTGDSYKQTHLLSISIDPVYDTPSVLRSYGAAYTGQYSDEKFDHWEFASGSVDQVKGIAQYFGLRYYAGEDKIVHGLRTAVIRPDGKIQKVYDGNEWQPEEAVSELSKALQGK